MDCYEKIHIFYEQNGKNKGVLYEKAAGIHEKIGQQAECAKYVLLALEEYKKEGN